MPEDPTALALLQGVDIFSGVPDPVLLALLATSEQREAAKGSAIFAEGDPAGGMYLVVDGAIELTQTVLREQQRLALLDRGQVFGELSLFDALPRSATATAFVDCHLLYFPANAFHELLDERQAFAPNLLRNVVKKLSLRLRDADSEIRELSRAGAR